MLQISGKTISSMVLFSSRIFLLIFCLGVLSIEENRVLRSPKIIICGHIYSLGLEEFFFFNECGDSDVQCIYI
jgi:hypothetical protein